MSSCVVLFSLVVVSLMGHTTRVLPRGQDSAWIETRIIPHFIVVSGLWEFQVFRWRQAYSVYSTCGLILLSLIHI